MKTMRNIVIGLAAMLLFVPLAGGQDLSKYRDFSLGTTLIKLAKQVDEKSGDARVVHQSPALIQEVTSWPAQSYHAASPDPVEKIVFSFLDGSLYRIAVAYDDAATKGMTAEDMVQAVSAKYGTAKRPSADSNPPASLSYSSSADTQLALWEDSQYSVALSRSPLSQSFQLVVLSKQLESQADAAIAEAVKQEREDAPQREIARVKKEADDLETLREANLKAFRP
jgi:hypothetical protein